VPGGGVALIRASKVLDSLKLGGDQQIGVNIVKRAIEEPIAVDRHQRGHEGSIVVQRVREMKDHEGFNALTDTYEDLVKAASSTPRRSSARRCRTPRRSPRCCSRPKLSSATSRKRRRMRREAAECRAAAAWRDVLVASR